MSAYRGRDAETRSVLFGPRGSGSAAGGTSIYDRQQEDIFEHQNDQSVNLLQSKVDVIKELSITIGREVTEQNRMLDDMTGDMDRAQGMLGKTMKRLDKLAKNAGGMGMCSMALFILFVFFLLYWVMRK
jgi:blocked-early-in-transport protein 1